VASGGGVGEPVASFLGFPCGILSRLPQASALDACAGARFLVGAAARPGSPAPAEPDAPFQSRPRLASPLAFRSHGDVRVRLFYSRIGDPDKHMRRLAHVFLHPENPSSTAKKEFYMH